MSGPGREPSEILSTHSYIVVESVSLVHRRLGSSAVRVLIDGFLPALSVMYVDEQLHGTALASFKRALRRRTSFVDHVSFAFMREAEIGRAFAFDRDFGAQGFEVVP